MRASPTRFITLGHYKIFVSCKPCFFYTSYSRTHVGEAVEIENYEERDIMNERVSIAMFTHLW